MPQRIGIDFIGSQTHIAAVDTDTDGQPTAEIDLYETYSDLEASVADNSSITVGVPDNLCQVKSLRLTASSESDLRLRAQFELSQSQLEPAESFLYDLISTERDHRLLGLIYRRKSLMEWISGCHLPESISIETINYRGRSAALGYGYMQFCRPVAGDLVCLADFGRPVVGICFVYNRQIVDLARRETVQATLSDEAALRRLAIDFKTIVNFRLMALADAGISVPLSQLVVVGASESLHSLLAEYFPVGVSRPELLLSVAVKGEFDDPAAGLVSLGLTVY